MTPHLIHRAEDGKRAPIRMGALVVHDDSRNPGRDVEDLGMGSLSLHRVVGGPHHRRDPVSGEVVEELWDLDAKQGRAGKLFLMVVEVIDIIGKATVCTTHLLGARAYDGQILAATLVTLERLIELDERRRRAHPDAEILEEMIDVGIALLDLRAACRERSRFAEITIPTLLRNLYIVGALTLAEQSEASPRGWTSNAIGWTHDICKTELLKPTRRTP